MQVGQIAFKLLLHVLIHAPDPQAEVGRPVDPLKTEAVADARRDGDRRDAAVENIEIGTGVVSVY
ncbi:hypothetical protein NUKP49_23800 [Klebsiella variicola]|nr:hypothetical protein NUKP49_23800 [Klebsiella variicola]